MSDTPYDDLCEAYSNAARTRGGIDPSYLELEDYEAHSLALADALDAVRPEIEARARADERQQLITRARVLIAEGSWHDADEFAALLRGEVLP